MNLDSHTHTEHGAGVLFEEVVSHYIVHMHGDSIWEFLVYFFFFFYGFIV